MSHQVSPTLDTLLELPLPLGVILIERERLIIRNRNLFMSMQYPDAFRLGSSLSEYIHPEDIEKLKEHIQQFSGGYEKPLSLRILDTHQKWQWAQLRLGCLETVQSPVFITACFIELTTVVGDATGQVGEVSPVSLEGIGLITQRETEVLTKIAEGKTDKEIAQELYLSAYTVMNHRRRLLKKLKAKNKVALVRISKEKGLL